MLIIEQGTRFQVPGTPYSRDDFRLWVLQQTVRVSPDAFVDLCKNRCNYSDVYIGFLGVGIATSSQRFCSNRVFGVKQLPPIVQQVHCTS
jgi:hypothetical protein